VSRVTRRKPLTFPAEEGEVTGRRKVGLKLRERECQTLQRELGEGKGTGNRACE
jgi:hypothetical protein